MIRCCNRRSGFRRVGWGREETAESSMTGPPTMQNPRYPLELFLRVITVSLETMKIVKALLKLDVLD